MARFQQGSLDVPFQIPKLLVVSLGTIAVGGSTKGNGSGRTFAGLPRELSRL